MGRRATNPVTLSPTPTERASVGGRTASKSAGFGPRLTAVNRSPFSPFTLPANQHEIATAVVVVRTADACDRELFLSSLKRLRLTSALDDRGRLNAVDAIGGRGDMSKRALKRHAKWERDSGRKRAIWPVWTAFVVSGPIDRMDELLALPCVIRDRCQFSNRVVPGFNNDLGRKPPTVAPRSPRPRPDPAPEHRHLCNACGSVWGHRAGFVGKPESVDALGNFKPAQPARPIATADDLTCPNCGRVNPTLSSVG